MSNLSYMLYFKQPKDDRACKNAGARFNQHFQLMEVDISKAHKCKEWLYNPHKPEAADYYYPNTCKTMEYRYLCTGKYTIKEALEHMLTKTKNKEVKSMVKEGGGLQEFLLNLSDENLLVLERFLFMNDMQFNIDVKRFVPYEIIETPKRAEIKEPYSYSYSYQYEYKEPSASYENL